MTERDPLGPTELLGNEWACFLAECEEQPHSDHSTLRTVARPEKGSRVDAFEEPVPPAA